LNETFLQKLRLNLQFALETLLLNKKNANIIK